jgi:hypothetical protein
VNRLKHSIAALPQIFGQWRANEEVRLNDEDGLAATVMQLND